ncbi:sulfate ABC transporter permease [Elstera cyanobacteriorum]|uniref:Sulfate transport system permease protein CysT n=1 Tax=Elstera cyanobacteriorum TaxID=2022747 RepID=A0A255XNE4_9PROT|nr:sulfate ABC transporter permease subunit CysT [Elstera cyanobacteriorum]OYQ18503.1 sulfate ABC transporter permease subunit CysT [Elstera cyanobacteriorum]GFZ79829.1 sulfate ABC transporter permease [Elstera cyanobacteriorum]
MTTLPPTVEQASAPASPLLRRRWRWKQPSVLPGFGLSLGLTLFWLSAIVLIPLGGMVLKSATLGWDAFFHAISSPRVLAALRLSIGGSLIAALINAVFGAIIAWVLVRYRFPGRRIADALVDIPFALPTAVAGISLTTLFAENGWLGAPLAKLGIQVAYTPLGVIVAMIFVGFPFVVRTVQPVLADLDPEVEEAALCLRASRWQTVRRVLLPSLFPALVTGAALAFARAVGEYGSVIFIAGNLPMVSEIAPLMIVIKLEEFSYAEATAIGTVMLGFAFLMLLALNGLQRWSRRHEEAS